MNDALKLNDKVYYIDFEESGASYAITGLERITKHPVFPPGILYTIHSDKLSSLTGYYALHELEIDKDGGRFFSTPEKAAVAYVKFKEFVKQKENEMAEREDL